jgi:hypothetical protein
MISQGYQGLVAELRGGAGGDAVIHEKDGFVPDIPGFQ